MNEFETNCVDLLEYHREGDTYEGETYNYLGCRLNAHKYRDIFSDTCELYKKEWEG